MLEVMTETVICSPCGTSSQPSHHTDVSRKSSPDEVHKRCIHPSPRLNSLVAHARKQNLVINMNKICIYQLIEMTPVSKLGSASQVNKDSGKDM